MYLLKDKSKVEQIFKNFSNVIENQFHTRMKVLKSGNGREYFTQVLGNFLYTKEILHQSSCIDSLQQKSMQQNRVTERKNRHLLEVTRTLMFFMKVPNYLWGDMLFYILPI